MIEKFGIQLDHCSKLFNHATNAQGEILVSDLKPGIYAMQETATIVIQNDKRPYLTIHKIDHATGADGTVTIDYMRLEKGYYIITEI